MEFFNLFQTNSLFDEEMIANCFYYLYGCISIPERQKGVDLVDSNYSTLKSYYQSDKGLSFLFAFYYRRVNEGIRSKRIENMNSADRVMESDFSNEVSRTYKDIEKNKNQYKPTLYIYLCLLFRNLKRGSGNDLYFADAFRNVNSSLLKAIIYYAKAELFHPSGAQYNTFEKYSYEYISNLTKAVELYPDFSLCLNDLAIAYSQGIGTKIDMNKANQYSERALVLGNAFAIYNEGVKFYREGKYCKSAYYFIKYMDLCGENENDSRVIISIHRKLEASANPFDLVHLVLILRLLSNLIGMKNVCGSIIDLLYQRPKLLRLVESVIKNPDKISVFDLDGIVNSNVVARTRHDVYATKELFEGYLNSKYHGYGHYDERESSFLDELFSPLSFEDFFATVDMYDRAVKSIGTSRVAETANMDAWYPMTE